MFSVYFYKYMLGNLEHMNAETHPAFSKQMEQSHSSNLTHLMIISSVPFLLNCGGGPGDSVGGLRT